MLMALGSVMSGWILLTTVLCRWFVRRRTISIALAHMVSRIGSISHVTLIVYGVGWFG